MKTIKFIIIFFLTFIGSLMVGLLLGACISGQSFAVMLDKLLSLSIVESVGIPLLSIFAMCLAAVVHIVLHEAGHLVFGLRAVISFCLTGFSTSLSSTKTGG